MKEKVVCTVKEVKCDNLIEAHKIIDKFANDKLTCEIDGNRVGGVDKLIIDWSYEYDTFKRRRLIIKAEVSLI